MEELEVVDEQPKLVQPDFVPEIPGIETEDDHDPSDDPSEEKEDSKPPLTSRIEEARHNAGLDTDVKTQANPRGVDGCSDF